MIFPEGTRTAPGTKGTYHPGGAWLAVKAGVAAIPIAHNAGECWPRNAFLKYPGLVTVSIGPPFPTRDVEPAVLNARIEQWIENEMKRIGTHEAVAGASA